MKISNSKKELARIISENGGWREGADTCSCDHDGYVSFFVGNPTRNGGSWLDNGDCEYIGGTIATKYEKIKNWHQTVLSREEYYQAYPKADADGWIEWKGGECPVDVGSVVDVRQGNGLTYKARAANFHWNLITGSSCVVAYRLHKPEQSLGELCGEAKEENKHEHIDAKPTIEQLAADYHNAKGYADRKQQETDAAKTDADEKLRVLEIAGEALGLLVTPITAKQDPEMVITDWRDLQVGDEIEYLDGGVKHKIGMIGAIDKFDHNSCTDRFFRIKDGYNFGWPTKWRFIRRP